MIVVKIVVLIFIMCLISALSVSALPNDDEEIERWLNEYEKKKRQKGDFEDEL